MDCNRNRFFPRIMIMILFLHCYDSDAQIFKEIFQQKKTQKEYLVKQIALLNVYLSYVKKGYNIVNNGLTTISNIREGDFNLHRDFFSSLRKVNPHISNSAKVADIIAFQIFVIEEMRKVNEFCKRNKDFTTEEIRYVAAVYKRFVVMSDASLAELYLIIRKDKTQMKDDQRLQRIDLLYHDLCDKHAFVQAFEKDLQLIARSRAREQRQNSIIVKNYDL